MPKVRNITVAVSPELYRSTRHIAAECDTSVTELVRFILTNLPNLLRRARHPAADWTGIPKRPSPPAAASTVPEPAAVSVPPAVPVPHPVASSPSAIPAPRPAAPAPQQSAYRARWAAARASRAAAPARSRAELLREAQRLLNS